MYRNVERLVYIEATVSDNSYNLEIFIDYC